MYPVSVPVTIITKQGRIRNEFGGLNEGHALWIAAKEYSHLDYISIRPGLMWSPLDAKAAVYTREDLQSYTHAIATMK